MLYTHRSSIIVLNTCPLCPCTVYSTHISLHIWHMYRIRQLTDPWQEKLLFSSFFFFYERHKTRPRHILLKAVERRTEHASQDPPAARVSSIQIWVQFSMSAERNVAAEEQDNVIGLHKSSSNKKKPFRCTFCSWRKTIFKKTFSQPDCSCPSILTERWTTESDQHECASWRNGLTMTRNHCHMWAAAWHTHGYDSEEV